MNMFVLNCLYKLAYGLQVATKYERAQDYALEISLKSAIYASLLSAAKKSDISSTNLIRLNGYIRIFVTFDRPNIGISCIY